jgi:hypothetical protein
MENHSEEQAKPVVQLTGTDGNAFAIMAACRRSARKAGWSNERIENVFSKMTEGDYDNLLQVVMDHYFVR